MGAVAVDKVKKSDPKAEVGVGGRHHRQKKKSFLDPAGAPQAAAMMGPQMPSSPMPPQPSMPSMGGAGMGMGMGQSSKKTGKGQSKAKPKMDAEDRMEKKMGKPDNKKEEAAEKFGKGQSKMKSKKNC